MDRRIEQFEGVGLVPEDIWIMMRRLPNDVVMSLPLEHYNPALVEMKHEVNARALGIRKGAMRKGVWDTGFCVLENRQWVSIAQLIQDLHNAGFVLVRACRFIDKKERNVGKLVFKKMMKAEEKAPEMAAEDAELTELLNLLGDKPEQEKEIEMPRNLKPFVEETWRNAHVWANPIEQGDEVVRGDRISVDWPHKCPAKEVFHLDVDDRYFTYRSDLE